VLSKRMKVRQVGLSFFIQLHMDKV